MIQFLHFVATVLALASTVVSTGLLVPLYSWPGTNAWNTIYDSIAAHPSVRFYLIINPENGPGAGEYPEDAYITAIAKLNSYSNTRVLGYTHTEYGSRARAEVEKDIAVYAKWSSYKSQNIGLTGIFFDEAPSGGDPSHLAYFQHLSQTTKESGLNTVIFNPGVKIVADVEKWFEAADFIVEYEDTYANWVALAPTEHFSTPENYGKDAMILNQTPEDADIDSVVKMAKGMGLGAIHLTYDDSYMSLATVPKIAVAVAQDRRVRSRAQ
ncbi:Spherulation-specific family 4 [Penicillium paradoxum]|uniref:Spherulation-specific family 4 n=1 Tax=Penicillium paradoxum TaxID=176176 RepID=UPI002546E3E2|nr:Spherulation-specific family 4 [Penicillium paradoxum]KAJ5773132.1 Spherulation-specific family 4 [Penicillium paradoxum]